ncbi:MAG: tryptophan synthase subunit alpha [Candidatus Aminicenantales bacterium]
MGKIGKKFSKILKQKKKAFIPFFTAFYPSPELFRDLILSADRIGADFIEIGVPFSDPLADGKTIQYSSHWVLKRNFSFSRLLEETARLKKNINASFLLMSYFNPLLQRGISNLGEELSTAKIEGVIVPDLPLEESSLLQKTLSSQEIDLIYLIAPTTSSERIKKIDLHSQGFIYLVSLTGVTGMRENLPPTLDVYLRRVRKNTSKPLCVGFGISNPAQARNVASLAEGVIVGSSLINALRGEEGNKNIIKKIEMLLTDFRRSI